MIPYHLCPCTYKVITWNGKTLKLNICIYICINIYVFVLYTERKSKLQINIPNQCRCNNSQQNVRILNTEIYFKIQYLPYFNTWEKCILYWWYVGEIHSALMHFCHIQIKKEKMCTQDPGFIKLIVSVVLHWGHPESMLSLFVIRCQ